MKEMRWKIPESWAAYGAAVWALSFSVLHFLWAAGWYVGLNEESARKAFQQRWFLVYDLVAAVLCALAVVVALALVRPWGRRLPRRLVGMLAWSGTAILALRGGAGLAQSLYIAVTEKNVFALFELWEIWFCVGAVLFGLSTWRFWRRQYLPGS
jgi:Protein of unknown function (DUF3995)